MEETDEEESGGTEGVGAEPHATTLRWRMVQKGHRGVEGGHTSESRRNWWEFGTRREKVRRRQG